MTFLCLTLNTQPQKKLTKKGLTRHTERCRTSRAANPDFLNRLSKIFNTGKVLIQYLLIRIESHTSIAIYFNLHAHVAKPRDGKISDVAGLYFLRKLLLHNAIVVGVPKQCLRQT